MQYDKDFMECLKEMVLKMATISKFAVADDADFLSLFKYHVQELFGWQALAAFNSREGYLGGRYLPPHWRDDAYMIKVCESLHAAVEEEIDPVSILYAWYMKLPIQHVVCAAERWCNTELPDGEIIILSPRHNDSTCRKLKTLLAPEIQAALKRSGVKNETYEQGFINQWGEFLSRPLAFAIVKRNGQGFSDDRNGGCDWLSSEGIY
jgi:hypothetical protein